MSEGAAKKEEKQRKFQAIRGTRDLLPPETALWNRVEQTAREIFATFGFGEIRPPIFEETELFARSIGDDTDVVSKEMYSFPIRPTTAELATEVLEMKPESFTTGGEFVSPEEKREFEERKKGESVSLRPEATASVCRAYIEHGMQQLPQPVKLYYMGPMFRRERPQKGRYRQFYQIGAEILGSSDSPQVDAELIEMLMKFFDRSGLKGSTLHINSIGDKKCRPGYVELLRAELRKVRDALAEDSRRRIETNPLRVLDSKVPSEQGVIETLPRISDHLCAACAQNFEDVKRELDLRGVRYEQNWRLVRGLDYYMRTTFEVTAPGLGSQNAVCGGGRYDGLLELLGGSKFRSTKGIGFAIGEDRLVLALQHRGAKAEKRVDILIAWTDAGSRQDAERVATLLRDSGLIVEVPLKRMSPGEGLGLTDKLNAPIGVVIGPGEVGAKTISMRLLSEQEQVSVSQDSLNHAQLRTLLTFRVLIERELHQIAILAGIKYQNVPPLRLAEALDQAGYLPSQLRVHINVAMHTFNHLIHGRQIPSEELDRAVAASMIVLNELSASGIGPRFSLGR